MIKACIFDLDGVIVDTAHYHYLAWKRLADELGIVFTEADNERLKGVSRMRSMQILLELGGVSVSLHDQERLANKKNTWFVDHVERMMPEEIYPGIKALLQSLRDRGMKIGLASSSKNAITVLQRLHIQEAFDVIVDGTMIAHAKPDPEIFVLAARRLGVSTHECVVFEDAEAGVEAALAAGMRCVGIGSGAALAKADLVLAAAAEFEWGMMEEFKV